MARSKGSKRRKSRNKTYKDHNISTVSEHARHRKVLSPPFKKIGNMQFSNWRDRRLVDLLWAAILTVALPRERYLELFRRIAAVGHRFSERDNTSSLSITHSAFSSMTDADFDSVLSPLLEDGDALESVRPLLHVESLPDRAHWQRVLANVDPPGELEIIGRAVYECLDHQSEPSTDCRWLKYLFYIAAGRMKFPESMQDTVEAVINYPNEGDLRKVRPFIRAGEIGLDQLDQTVEGDHWSVLFWKEMWERTECVVPGLDLPHLETDVAPENIEPLFDDLGRIYNETVGHFFGTNTTTGVDARHDGAFGLVLYGLSLAMSALRMGPERPESRLILRALTECVINFSFLLSEDREELWVRFRNHGVGQAKLAFLKLIEDDEIPNYVAPSELEMLANEDMWQEFVDIDLGAWDSNDLRKRAEKSGLKEVYDKYYGWPSGFVHGQWTAVRNVVFTMCVNPLHRFHRVPRVPPRIDLGNATTDLVRLVNVMLDKLNKAYPVFKPRVRSKQKVKPEKSVDE